MREVDKRPRSGPQSSGVAPGGTPVRARWSLVGQGHVPTAAGLQRAIGNRAFSRLVAGHVESGFTRAVVQRSGGAALSSASGSVVGAGTVRRTREARFVLNIDPPQPGKYWFFRWSARDAENNAYLMRASDGDSVVQGYAPHGIGQEAYIPQGSLQLMFDRGAGSGCKVLCRVLEKDDSARPTSMDDRGAQTRLFSLDFDFDPVPTEYERTPQSLTTLAWAGDIDHVTWMAGAVRAGEIDVTTIDALADEVEGAMTSDRHYLKELKILGHGASGHMSPNLTSVAISGAGRAALTRLRPLFGTDSTVRLDGCEVAQGAVGRRFIQQLSDLLAVPVVAQTSYVHALGWYTLGVEELARPGEVLGSDAEIVADQVYRTITETTVITARIVTKQLEHAKAAGYLDGVVAALRAEGRWAAVRAKLDFWHSTAILPWFGEDASISARVGRLGILRHPVEEPAPTP